MRWLHMLPTPQALFQRHYTLSHEPQGGYLKDSTAKPMNLLSRGKEPPHVTHRDSHTFRVITITTTWLVRTRPGSRVHSLSAPYTNFFYPPTHHLLNILTF